MVSPDGHARLQVSAGAAHSLFVGQHGQLWGCGSNTELQLAQEQSVGTAALPQRILQAADRPVRFAVAAGAHSLAVLEQHPQANGQLRSSSGTFPAARQIPPMPCSVRQCVHSCLYVFQHS